MAQDVHEQLAGWGRLAVPGREIRGERLEALAPGSVLSRGLGRSYGDSSLPPPGTTEVLGTTLADRILAFDRATGVIRCEAGLSLVELHRLMMPRGWFSPVTPGTEYVTVGGMVASDVHGKNHHQHGCFGAHVTALRMWVADGRIVDCSPTVEPDLFRATVGGMGLTGHILEVEFELLKIPTQWIWQHSTRIPNIDRFIDALKDARDRWPYTMGWIDCISRGNAMGRGVLYRGRFATPDEAPRRPPKPRRRITMPMTAPNWALNGLTMRLFNAAVYWKHLRRDHRGIVHPAEFFYPLDSILHWNRLYGSRGFTQYQCVLPDEAGRDSARRFLDLLTTRGGASFLCVIKDCGDQGVGLLSFPMPGISIALDIPVRDGTQALIDALNEFVIAEGGRMYLTKDAFTRPEHYRAMEPRLARWEQIRETWDPQRTFRSAQSVRVLGDGA